MIFGAIDIGAQVEHGGCAARCIGQLGGNGRTVDPVHGLQHVAGDRHECTGIAGGHSRLRGAVLHLIDRHPHRRVFFTPQRNLYRVIHADDLGRRHKLATRMGDQPGMQRMGGHGLGLSHDDQLGLRVVFKKGQAGGQCHGRTEVSTHGINSDPDHGAAGAIDC